MIPESLRAVDPTPNVAFVLLGLGCAMLYELGIMVDWVNTDGNVLTTASLLTVPEL